MNLINSILDPKLLEGIYHSQIHSRQSTFSARDNPLDRIALHIACTVTRQAADKRRIKQIPNCRNVVANGPRYRRQITRSQIRGDRVKIPIVKAFSI